MLVGNVYTNLYHTSEKTRLFSCNMAWLVLVYWHSVNANSSYSAGSNVHFAFTGFMNFVRCTESVLVSGVHMNSIYILLVRERFPCYVLFWRVSSILCSGNRRYSFSCQDMRVHTDKINSFVYTFWPRLGRQILSHDSWNLPNLKKLLSVKRHLGEKEQPWNWNECSVFR